MLADFAFKVLACNSSQPDPEGLQRMPNGILKVEELAFQIAPRITCGEFGRVYGPSD